MTYRLPTQNNWASIRPRRNRRGDPESSAGKLVLITLQFGHDVTAVETRAEETQVKVTIELQFGHDVTAVETVSMSFSKSDQT